MVGRRKKQTRQGGWKGRKDYVEVCCDEVLISVFFHSLFLFSIYCSDLGPAAVSPQHLPTGELSRLIERFGFLFI